MYTFDIYCLICAGPLDNIEVVQDKLAASGSPCADTRWLGDYVGIPKNNVPMDLYGYNAYGVFYSYPPGPLFYPRLCFHSALNYSLRYMAPEDQQA